MGLSGLFPLLGQVPEFTRLAEALGGDTCAHRLPCPDAARPFLLGALARQVKRPLLVLCPHPEDARQLHEQLLAWCGEQAPLYYLPEVETLPFERLVPDAATIHQRLRALDALLGAGNAHAGPAIVVASVPGVTQKTLGRRVFQEASQTLRRGDRVDLLGLLRRWEALGYHMERAVEVPGAVSHRGGIVDIWPPSEDLPVRLELFGPEVESLRRFDPGTQRSVEALKRVRIVPAAEVLPALTDPTTLERLWETMDPSPCAQVVQERIKEEVSLLASGQSIDDLPFYAGFFCTGLPLDYLPPEAVLVVDHPSQVQEAARELDHRASTLREAKQERGELPLGFPSSHVLWNALEHAIARWPRRLALESWDVPGEGEGRGLTFTPVRSYWGRMGELLEHLPDLLAGQHRVVLVSTHAARLAEVVGEAGYKAPPRAEMAETPAPGSLALVHEALSEGFRLSLPQGDLTILTDAELFGTARRMRPQRRVPVRREAFLSELEPGGYVVHTEHGIGRFTGTLKLTAEEGEKEYLVLEYAEGDKLYVPTDQLDRVAPYVATGDRSPALTRLGTQEWARAKERVKESARELARGLLELYAARQVVRGVAFSPDAPWQREMEDAFPYAETPDQMDAILEVKTDMESARPMDRLVCGDVGYGKTEVALRAAFKAMMDGYQVAVLVPTTVLAQQHYATFTERLSPYPVKLEVLSRFRTPAEQTAVVQALARGEVDIAVGTHRLLQRDVAFKNLGLVVIDEEQRFGVAHKERLKQMRREVDVLTLTATPIPRTLHLSLAGVRDMSTMETPPEERLPIKSYVSEDSQDLIREAILREVDRGGQVYFVHNRVQTIHAMAEQVRRLVPEATVGVGHGRMPEEELAAVMAAFAAGEIDVLVCTTIIEAGLDIPNVNTLIVNRADRFGLAQLYQLRGRIGRSGRRAYAYLLVPRGRRITETAERRLKTILAATELGAGFRIAMKDLEIRGAGNILGPEQSGHIHAVGFDLYTRLLAEAVEEARAQQAGATPTPSEPAPEVKAALPLPAHIPEAYVPDLPIRLSLYQRCIALRQEEQVDALAEELRDRFGPPPETVENLLYVVRLRLVAAQAQVEAVESSGSQVVIKLGNWQGVDRAAIQRAVGPAGAVGHTQVRLEMARLGKEWRSSLLMAVRRLAYLRHELLARLAQSGVVR